MNSSLETQAKAAIADRATKIFGQGASASARHGSSTGLPVRVLIVEDMSTMRSVVRNGIKQTFHNAEIEEAVDGADAQKKLEEAKFDLIISDWEMPHVNGVDLLKWVRTHPAHKNMPFIMVTANHQKECVEESVHLGVNAFLLKPFTVEALTAKMGSLIERFNRREFERFNVNCPVKIINPVDKREIRGELIDVSCGGLFATFPRVDYCPNVFDDVGVDINYQAREGEIITVHLTGFVIRLQSATTFRDASHIKIAVKFDDHAVNENKDVEKFFEHLR